MYASNRLDPNDGLDSNPTGMLIGKLSVSLE
jgi:hypothetical protein